jgi:hypothetical protein
MRDVRSSKPDAVKLSNFHIVITSLAAVAGVAIAGYQAFAPQPSAQQPVNVVVSLDQQNADAAAAGDSVAKTDAPALMTETVNLAQNASFAAALKDGSENRYNFASLFDGESDTFLAIEAPDQELNILVMFNGSVSRDVTALEYIPPAGVDPRNMAATVDVMVLPEGQLEASGRPVISFSLPQSAETRTFAIPGRAEGKGLWLRVAAAPGQEKSYVGDFRVLSERVAP